MKEIGSWRSQRFWNQEVLLVIELRLMGALRLQELHQIVQKNKEDQAASLHVLVFLLTSGTHLAGVGCGPSALDFVSVGGCSRSL